LKVELLNVLDRIETPGEVEIKIRGNRLNVRLDSGAQVPAISR